MDVSLFLIPFLRSSPVHINAREQCLHKMWVTPSNNIDRALIVAYAHLIVLTCNQFQRILLFIVSTIYTFFLHFSIFSFAMCMQVTESVCAFFLLTRSSCSFGRYEKKTFIAICIIIIAIEQQTRNWKMLRGSNNIDLFSINLFSPFTEDHLYVLGAVLAMRNELREREIEIEREREKNWIY